MKMYHVRMLFSEICLESSELDQISTILLHSKYNYELVCVAEEQLPAFADSQVLDNVLASFKRVDGFRRDSLMIDFLDYDRSTI